MGENEGALYLLVLKSVGSRFLPVGNVHADSACYHDDLSDDAWHKLRPGRISALATTNRGRTSNFLPAKAVGDSFSKLSFECFILKFSSIQCS